MVAAAAAVGVPGTAGVTAGVTAPGEVLVLGAATSGRTEGTGE